MASMLGRAEMELCKSPKPGPSADHASYLRIDRADELKRSGIEPAPERGKRTRWSTFLSAHWNVLAASDFLTLEVWTTTGLVTHSLLSVINLADRVVNIASITTRPDESC